MDENIYKPQKFWFCKDHSLSLPFIVSLFNTRLQHENPEKYNAGYRVIDMKEYGFRYANDHTNDDTDRYQLWQLNEEGKIIINFVPASDLVVVYPKK